MTTRPAFFLLITVLFIVTLAGVAERTSSSASVARTDVSKALLPENSISTSYSDLLARPVREIKVSFRNAAATDKSNLWRTHLRFVLDKHSELNEQQKNSILAAMSLATPEFFGVRLSDPDWKAKVQEPLRSLEKQIMSAFSRQDAVKIFATLGGNVETTICGATNNESDLLNNINKPISGRPVAVNELIFDKSPCECSTQSDWCALSSYCTGTNCAKTDSGCGTLWSYPCDGAACK